MTLSYNGSSIQIILKKTRSLIDIEKESHLFNFENWIHNLMYFCLATISSAPKNKFDVGDKQPA
jgi:hypothetical protein